MSEDEVQANMPKHTVGGTSATVTIRSQMILLWVNMASVNL
jgi:hypothetical protein